MLFEPLFAHARNQGDSIAIIDDTGEYSYKQLAAAAAGLAMYLASQTAKPHVGILLPPGAAFVASFYGILLAGKSIVPINYLIGERETAHVLQDSGIDTVITIPQLGSRIKDADLKVIDITQLPKTPPAMAPNLPSPQSEDLAVLMYTSGTSALPKGVMLTYGNLQSDTDAAIEHAGMQRRHVFLGVLPLFHSFGMTATMLAPIQLGATSVYIARFSAMACLNAVRKHNASLMFGVPSMYAAMLRLDSAKPEDFKDMFAFLSGGEPLPAAIRERFETRFGQPILEGYGLTETSPVVSLNTPRSHRAASVGQLVPGAEVRIVDEEGRPLGPEQVGEIWLRGPMIMKGYYNLPKETADVLTADRYFKTGDLGKVDKDGFIYITGRKKELIICAGEKVVPREVEEVLAHHPSVAEVAVVGRKDATRGEAVVAFVVSKDPALKADALRVFCRDQGLVNFKIPREIFFVPDLPHSPTGKVLKRLLVEKANQSAT